MTKKAWMISFLALLGINVAIAGFLTYDIGFNDSEITNKTLEKIQDKVLSYKGELLDEVDKVNENPTAYSVDEILERTGLSDVKDEDAVKKQNQSIATPFIYTRKLSDDERPKFLEFFNKNKKEFRVTSVPDGDTIGGYWVSDADKATYGENRQSIRMTSIDTPESTSLTKPNVWQKNWGKKAGAFAKNLLHNADSKVKVYVLATSDSSHGRVVGSVWYEKTSEQGDIEIYSYAHDVLSAGLAIPARLKTQTHYSLDSGDATDIKDKGDIELTFETTLNDAFRKGIKDKVGMWNDDTSTNTSLEGYQTYDKTTNWYDIFNGDMDYLDIHVPTLTKNLSPSPIDYSTRLNQFATIIELYVYPSITWWQSDDDSKRKTDIYCTLDTLTNAKDPCKLYL